MSPSQDTPHVAPLSTLLAVFASLVLLTFLTVGATWFDFGPANLFVAMGIATVKASLVVLYFMHLRWDMPFNAIVFIATLCFVMLFVGFVLLDTTQYQPDLIPGFAPAMGG